MQGRDIPVATMVVIASGAAVWALSQASLIPHPDLASPAVAARPRTAVLSHGDRPVDADYAVPGLLDYRSWKASYDTAPGPAPSFAARRTRPHARPADRLPQETPLAMMALNTPLPEDEVPVAAPAERPAVLLTSATLPQD